MNYDINNLLIIMCSAGARHVMRSKPTPSAPRMSNVMRENKKAVSSMHQASAINHPDTSLLGPGIEILGYRAVRLLLGYGLFVRR